MINTKHIFLALALIITSQLIAQEQSNTPYIEVESEVERKVVPDRIYLSLLVKASKSKSIDKIEHQVVSRLAKAGIPEERISLQDAESDLINVWYKKKRIVDQKQYQILVHNTNELSDCMEVLDMEGVENLRVSHTEYSKEEEIKLEMVTEAMKKAQTKAKTMMAAINFNIGNPILIRENRVFIDHYKAERRQVLMSNEIESAPSRPNISFKKLPYKVQVYVRYAIGPKAIINETTR